jgi:hypothetical protein
LRKPEVKRLVIAALLAASPLISAGAETASSYPPLTIPLKIDQVPGKPVWYSTGNPGIPGKDNEGNTSNAGFVVTSDGVVVFDALVSDGRCCRKSARSPARKCVTWS